MSGFWSFLGSAQPFPHQLGCGMRCPLKGKNRSASSIARFTCSEVPQCLGGTRFIPCATGQRSLLGDIALGCRESVACSGHFPSSLPAGRKPSADRNKFCLCWKVSFFSVHAQGIPALSLWAQGELYRREQSRLKHLPSTTEHARGPSEIVCLCACVYSNHT